MMGRPRCCGILAYPIAMDTLVFQHPRDPGGLRIDSEHAVRDKHVRYRGLVQLDHVDDCWWMCIAHPGTQLPNQKEKETVEDKKCKLDDQHRKMRRAGCNRNDRNHHRHMVRDHIEGHSKKQEVEAPNKERVVRKLTEQTTSNKPKKLEMGSQGGSVCMPTLKNKWGKDPFKTHHL